MSRDMSSEEPKEDSDDVAWLEALERGDSKLPEIDPTRAETYQRMQLEISALPEDMAPLNDDWKKAIYAEMAREKQSEGDEELNAKEEGEKSAEFAKPAVEIKGDDRVVPITRISDAKKPKRWMSIVASLTAAAAVAAGAFFVTRSTEPTGELARGSGGDITAVIAAMPADPVAKVISGDGPRRSSSSEPHRGVLNDTISVTVDGGQGELRLYLDGEIFARCSDDCATPVADGRWSYKLDSRAVEVGEYRPVFLECKTASRGKLDPDLKSCLRRSLGNAIKIQ